MVTRTREKSSKRYNEGTKTHKIQAFVQFLRLHGLATSVAGQSSHSCGVYQTTDIMEYGLPQLEQRDLADGATEHINALGQFALNWLTGYKSPHRACTCTLKRKNIRRTFKPRSWHTQVGMHTHIWACTHTYATVNHIGPAMLLFHEQIAHTSSPYLFRHGCAFPARRQ